MRLKDMEDFHDDKACQGVPVTHILIQAEDGSKKMEISKLDVGLNDRIKLKLRDPYVRTEDEPHPETPTNDDGNLILKSIQVSVGWLNSS